MNPNDHPNEPSPGDENVADRNVERLLSGAYQPEVPDAALVARATAAMHAAAAQRHAASPSRPQGNALARVIGWAVAATLLVGVGMLLGWKLLGNPADDGRHTTEVAVKDGQQQPTGAARKTAGQPARQPAARADLPGAAASPAGATGLIPRPRGKTVPPPGLAQGKSLETKPAERRRVALPDGSLLYVNENTVVTLDGPRHVTLRRGEIFVEVAPRKRGRESLLQPAEATKGRRSLLPATTTPDPFFVVTPDREIIALGTKFNVRRSDAGTSVVVTQGKVQVSGLTLPLLAGQQLAVEAAALVDKRPVPPESPVSAAPRASHVLDWTRDLMAAADSPLVPESQYAGGALVVVDPQGQQARLSLRNYHVDVFIEDGFARTTIDQTYFNEATSRLEGTFYFPLPPDASLSRLAMYVGSKLMEGGMAEREYARQVFESIVYRQKDPALLEWIDGSTFKMRVFPLEGRQEKRIILSYTQKLPSLYGRTEYRFPGGHNMQEVDRWTARLYVKDGAEKGGSPHLCEAPSGPFRQMGTVPFFRSTEQGNDLVLEASAEKIKPDRDVVLILTEKQQPSPQPSPKGRGDEASGGTGALSASAGGLSASARFTSVVHEGSRYLMLRWRPELPGQKRRERRDWVLLFEASADRDPLLARAQIDVIKTILENAEHDDTFAIVTAGTQTHTLSAKPQAASPENVANAVKFLEQTHLVGALDLERALAATEPFCKAGKNPYLVHVGSGVPVLGRRDIDVLVKQIPQRTHYVGIGVGKRWSRNFMKTAAARTGGYFTQINPDEQVAWRAFELVATLNTPRLLNVSVVDNAEQLTFLCYNDSLAQGEELCAIARFDAGRAIPNSSLPNWVEVTGLLDGKIYREKIPLANMAQDAGYLPRTWAKLEIDRLVAEGAEKNKQRIIDLSKAMYVMSPFTSLLVLEDEAMYVQYKVDRGRKDHWAMYACPAEIKVVYEPLTTPLSPSGRGAGGEGTAGKPAAKPTAEHVLQRILVRSGPRVLSRGGPSQTQGNLPPTVVQRYDYSFNHGIGGTLILNGSNTYTGATTINGGTLGVGHYGMPVRLGTNATGQADFDSLIELITSTVRPTAWQNGPSGSIAPFSTNLSVVVSQNQALSTGRIMLGVGVNSDLGLYGPIMLDEQNFDLRGFPAAAPEGGAADFDRERRLLTQVIQTEVPAAVNQARAQMSTDPEGASQNLRLALERVKQAPEINAEVRRQLVDHIQAALREAGRRTIEAERRRQQQGESSATQRERMLLIDSLERQQEKVRHLMTRFESVMSEGSYRAADGTVVGNVLGLQPNTPLPLISTMPPPIRSNLGGKVYPVADLVLPIGDPNDLRVNAWGYYPQAWRTWDLQDGTSNTLMAVENGHVPRAVDVPIVYPDADVWRQLTARRNERYNSMDLARRGPAEKSIIDALKSPTEFEFYETPLDEVVYFLREHHKIEVQIDKKALEDLGIGTDMQVTKSLKGISLRSALKLMLRELDLTYVIVGDVLLITTPEVADNIFCEGAPVEAAAALTVAELIYRTQYGLRVQPLVYQAPAFSGDWAVFYDLPGYAPGMYTTAADVYAVLEAEAEPHPAAKPGKIDPQARRLIETARGAGWQTATSATLSIDFDGSGRYRCERTTAMGLREQVICDGATLWHLYPELGLGGRRVLSRFHRAQLSQLVPWVLPPAEDLARGADLVAVEKNTVAIVPHGIEDFKDSKGKPLPYARVHLIFDENGRLAERRLVEMRAGTMRAGTMPAGTMPAGKVLLRQTYAADGSVSLLSAKDKMLSEWKMALKPCGAPNLSPDTRNLVVVPLPVRTRDNLQEARNLPQNGPYENWSEDDALSVVAADLQVNTSESQQVLARRFLNRGDRRLGLYVLLAATGYTWDTGREVSLAANTLRLDPPADHPHEPLAKYIAGYLKARQTDGAEIGPVGGPRDGLLQQLADLHDLRLRWTSGKANQGDEQSRRRDRHRTLRFIRNCRSPAFGWALLCTAIKQTNDADFCRTLAEAALRFENVPALRYAARYEHAAALFRVASLGNGNGSGRESREPFRKLYTETFQQGVLPPIDDRFCRAFQSDADGSQQWQALMRETAEKLITEHARPAAVRLAWQVRLAGDAALAEQLLALATGKIPDDEEVPTTLAAVEYLAQNGRQPQADALLQPLVEKLLASKAYGQWPALWRLAAAVAERRGMSARSLTCTERAMELEFQHLPEKVNVQAIRQQYTQLLGRYQQLATALATVQSQAPQDFLGRVIVAADRWRAIDPDPTAACQAAAKIFADLGAADLAWEYLTTPLAARPNEAAPWISLAETLRQQAQFDLADRAYASAFEAEPTNARILWDRAQVLQQTGRTAEAQKLLRQIADGQWQPAFEGLKSQAKQAVGY